MLLSSLFEHVRDANFDFQAIVGDFNCPFIDWNFMIGPSSTQFLLDSCLDNFLTQLVDTPTRGDHILDLVLVNDPPFFCCCE